MGLYRIPVVPGDIGDDGPVEAYQSVQQAGFFPHWALPMAVFTLPQNPPLAVGLQKRIDFMASPAQRSGIVERPKSLDVLIG